MLASGPGRNTSENRTGRQSATGQQTRAELTYKRRVRLLFDFTCFFCNPALFEDVSFTAPSAETAFNCVELPPREHVLVIVALRFECPVRRTACLRSSPLTTLLVLSCVAARRTVVGGDQVLGNERCSSDLSISRRQKCSNPESRE